MNRSMGLRDLPPEALMPLYGAPPSRFLGVDGLTAHYRDEGRGPVVVLLHGTASSLHTWEGWAARLAADFRVLRVDLPGFGLTGPDPRREYRIDRYVRFVAAFLDAVEAAGPVHLAGNSLGGHVAAAFALAHPRRVERLILVDAAGYPGTVRWPLGLRLARVPGLRRLVTSWTPRWLVARTLRQAYGDPRRISPALVDRHHRLLLRRGNRQALVDRLRLPPPPPPELGMLETPTLIQWGAEDTWIPVVCAHRFHRDLPRSELVLYPGAGHVPMEEIPEATAVDARHFLLGSRLLG